MRQSFAVVPILSALLIAGCGSGSSTQSSIDSALKGGGSGGTYVQRNLVSNGAVPAEHTDPNLVNAWGIAHLPASPWWVSDNGANVSTLYNGDGVAQPAVNPLVVGVTGGQFTVGGKGNPTGVVANANASNFFLSSGANAARFIFASEDGTVSGWNPAADATHTIVKVDNSSSDPLGGAVYKGLAIAGDRIYATNFRGGQVEVFDATFSPVANPGFVDPGIPAGFGPFGIAAIGGQILVTYAKQDDTKHDDVPGKHLGFVSAFTTEGAFVRRVASRGKLNSPWGLALAPAGFGRFSGQLLVGNFGDGHIIGYRLDENENENEGEDDGGGGAYLTGHGGPIVIDGLWGIGFGNGAAAGPTNTLFFAAGPNEEADGLFGRIDFAPATE